MSLLFLLNLTSGAGAVPGGDYLQARSAIAYSGVTYAGWTPPNFTMYVNGVAVLPLQNQSWVLADRVGSPPSLAFDLRSTPTLGHDVKLAFTTPDEYWFGGTLLDRTAQPFAPGSSKLIWRCTAYGYQWLLDRFDKVLARFYALGVNTIVARLLHDVTDGGFRVGYIPDTLGNQEMQFTFEEVSDAVRRLAVSKGATHRITPDKVVDVYTSYPEAALATVTQADIIVGSLSYNEDLTQVRTRVLLEGRGSEVAIEAGPSATAISVNDISAFQDTGGFAVSGQSLITYTGRSAQSGPGELTGVTGIAYDLPEGDPIQVVVEVEDTGAQTALATVLGSGLSGQATHYLQDRRESVPSMTSKGNAQLDMFDSALPDLAFTFKIPRRHLRAGRILTMNITDPFTVTGNFLVQSVTTTIRGDAIGGTKVSVFQAVTASRVTQSFANLLQQLEA